MCYILARMQAANTEKNVDNLHAISRSKDQQKYYGSKAEGCRPKKLI